MHGVGATVGLLLTIRIVALGSLFRFCDSFIIELAAAWYSSSEKERKARKMKEIGDGLKITSGIVVQTKCYRIKLLMHQKKNAFLN